MGKYRLSTNISILTPADYAVTMELATPLEGRYVLLDQQKGKEFLINETVKYFLDKFSDPKTLDEVFLEIARDVQSDVKKIEKQCTSFFKFLSKRKIVVPEDWVEPATCNQPFFEVGHSIAEWCLTEVISNKQYIDIYLATHKSNGTACVIKLLNVKKADNKETYAEDLLDLKHEYCMLQRIKHIPFIGQAYAFSETEPAGAYILLEYIKGKPLSKFLQQPENLTEAGCYTLIDKMLEGFASLHETNLIHGDIHPSNIMVQEDGSVKIIDLGLTLDVNIEQDELVRFGGVIYYMPPERINVSNLNKFSREPNFYSDVYQLGLIMYYVFFRTEPFSGFIWEELSTNIKKSEATFPALSFLGFPVLASVIKVIKKCLQKQPAKRYATATALLADYKKAVLEKEVFMF